MLLAAAAAAAITLIIVTPCALLGVRSTSRTDTRHQTVFALSQKHPVTFDFGAVRPSSAIEIRVPAGSRWTSPVLYHETEESCRTVSAVQEPWFMGPGIFPPGVASSERPRRFVSFGPAGTGDRTKEATARLTTATVSGDQQALQRTLHTLCSIVQDAEGFFGFRTTPLWLRACYCATYAVPLIGRRMRVWLIDTALWFQMRVVYAGTDTWTYEGQLPLDRIWIWPPPWAEELQFSSRFWMSKAVVRFAAAVGRHVLGMRETYPEYEWLDGGRDAPDAVVLQGELK